MRSKSQPARSTDPAPGQKDDNNETFVQTYTLLLDQNKHLKKTNKRLTDELKRENDSWQREHAAHNVTKTQLDNLRTANANLNRINAAQRAELQQYFDHSQVLLQPLGHGVFAAHSGGRALTDNDQRTTTWRARIRQAVQNGTWTHRIYNQLLNAADFFAPRLNIQNPIP